MKEGIFRGELVRLTEDDPEALAKAFVRWGRDTELSRLLDSDPPRLWSEKKAKEWIEKDIDKLDPNDFFFTIRSLDDEKLIGFIGLVGLSWHHGDAWIAIAIGEREYWGRGYGTDAMRIIQKYGFHYLNLRRLTLLVFEYNERAMRSYEKTGFIVEGRVKESMLREGKRWDWIFMGILREEWEKRRSRSPAEQA